MLVNNFERVEKGCPYATINGEPQIAEEAFYPVLMSATGYASQFGYAAELTDRLEPCASTEERCVADDVVTAIHH